MNVSSVETSLGFQLKGAQDNMANAVSPLLSGNQGSLGTSSVLGGEKSILRFIWSWNALTSLDLGFVQNEISFVIPKRPKPQLAI